MKILLTNAPPRAGKDSLARHLIDNAGLIPGYRLHFERFSRPLKGAFAGMIDAAIDPFHNVEYYEDHKSDIIPLLGISFRQWQIDFSEKFMKPLYGDDIFTRIFYDRVKKIGARDEKNGEQSLFIVADCGFDIELKALLNYGVPAGDILLMRVHRPGCTYKGDSRSYIHNEDVLSCDIGNDSTESIYYERSLAAILMWLQGEAHMNDMFSKRGD